MTKRRFLKYGVNFLVKNILSLYYYRLAQKAYRVSEDDFWMAQIQLFKRAYNRAVKKVPYYKKNSYPKIDFDRVKTKEDFLSALSSIPILTKKELRAHQSQFVSGKKVFVKSQATSGSTGIPVKIISTYPEKLKLHMIKNYWFKQLTGKLFPKILILTGYYKGINKSIVAKDFLTGHLFISIKGIRPENTQFIKDFIEQERPDVIWGYASPIHLMAKLLERSPVDNKSQMIAISTSEVLRLEWRNSIESSLVSKVYDFYSSQECTHGIFEHSDGSKKLHPFMGVVEVLDDEGSNLTSGKGRVIGTGFLRKKMPFIRYELGDQIESLNYKFETDNKPNWPNFGDVYGRLDDQAVRKDGSRVAGLFADSVFKDLDDVIEGQLIQKGFHNFTCNLVIRNKPNKTMIERHIGECVSDNMGYEVEVSYNYLSFIERGANEKLRSLIIDFKEK